MSSIPELLELLRLAGWRRVDNLATDLPEPNDARFVQDLHVREQSWYHITGKVRTENVGQGAIGAYLSLMEGFQNSQDVKGTHPDWEALELWVKTEKWQDRLQLALRLGGYSSLNTGEAWFTDIVAEPVSGPAPNAKNDRSESTAVDSSRYAAPRLRPISVKSGPRLPPSLPTVWQTAQFPLPS